MTSLLTICSTLSFLIFCQVLLCSRKPVADNYFSRKPVTWGTLLSNKQSVLGNVAIPRLKVALGSTSIRYRSDTFVSDRYLIDVDLRIFAIWVAIKDAHSCYKDPRIRHQFDILIVSNRYLTDAHPRQSSLFGLWHILTVLPFRLLRVPPRVETVKGAADALASCWGLAQPHGFAEETGHASSRPGAKAPGVPQGAANGGKQWRHLPLWDRD